MPSPESTQPPADIPSVVFEKFFQNLKAAGAGEDLVGPLQNVLMVQKSYTEKSLRDALFGGEPIE